VHETLHSIQYVCNAYTGIDRNKILQFAFFGCYSKLLSKLQLKNYLTKKVPKLLTLQVIRNTVVKKGNQININEDKNRPTHKLL